VHERNHKLMNIVSTERHTPYAGAFESCYKVHDGNLKSNPLS